MMISTINFDRLGPEQRSGFFTWLPETASDVVCLQGANADHSHRAREAAQEVGWYVAVATSSGGDGQGVAIFTRIEPETHRVGFDPGEFDDSGRYVELYLKDVVIGSVDVPSASTDGAAEEERTRFLQVFAVYLGELRGRAEAGGKEVLTCGSGSLALGAENTSVQAPGPVEYPRVQLAQELNEAGYVDVVGAVGIGESTAATGQVAHFPNYHVATADLAERMTTAWTEPLSAHAATWSEGAAVTVQYDL